MLKNIYFLCSLPRCGNTLLASILNQNLNITVTANSIGADILYSLEKLKQKEIFFNIELIKKYITSNPKFIILERPFIEILSSFARIKNWNKKHLNNHCFYEMTEGMTARCSYAIYNIIQSNSDYIRIDYDDLTTNPEKNINRIYKFLNIPKHKHRYVDMDQLNINNIKYDDSVLDGIHHDVKEGKVEKNNYDLNMYLTESIINKYKNVSLESLGEAIFNNEVLF